MTKAKLKPLTVTAFESLGTIGGAHLAGYATFSDGTRLRVWGHVGGDWTFKPNTPEGMRSVGRPLHARRAEALNAQVGPVLEYERTRKDAADRVRWLTEALTAAVEATVIQLQGAGARMVDKAAGWARELDAAAEAAKRIGQTRVAASIADVARGLRAGREAAESKNGEARAAEHALNEAKAQFEALGANRPALRDPSNPDGGVA